MALVTHVTNFSLLGHKFLAGTKIKFILLSPCDTLKVRFPKEVSIATILKRRYGNQGLKSYRDVEKLDFKLKKIKCDVEFLQLCKENRLTPSFLHFKLYNKDLSSSHLYRKFQEKLLDHELKQKRTQQRILSRKLKSLKSDLQSTFSHFDFLHLSHLIENCNRKKIKNRKNNI